MEVGYKLSPLLPAVYRQPIALLSNALFFCQLVGNLYHMSDDGQFVFC